LCVSFKIPQIQVPKNMTIIIKPQNVGPRKHKWFHSTRIIDLGWVHMLGPFSWWCGCNWQGATMSIYLMACGMSPDNCVWVHGQKILLLAFLINADCVSCPYTWKEHFNTIFGEYLSGYHKTWKYTYCMTFSLMETVSELEWNKIFIGMNRDLNASPQSHI